MSTMPVLTRNLRRYRMAKGFSQKKLGELAKINTATINRFENDFEADPQLSSLERVASVLGITVVDLLLANSRELEESHEKPRWVTFSAWFWEKFYETVGEWAGELIRDEKTFRMKFESFLLAVENDEMTSQELKEKLWDDRLIFKPKR